MDLERLKNTRCFLLDMDGTVFLDDQLLPGAGVFLEYLRSKNIPYYFITNNSSKSRTLYLDKLNRLGLPVKENQIFTSGEATAIYLQKVKPRARLYVVGTPSLENELRAYGFDLVQDAPDFAVLGFDTTLTYQKIWKFCDFIRAGVPYIATHPDINCPTKTGFMPDIGAMMAMIEASTGKRADVVIGKPNPPIVEAIIQKIGIPAAEMAMIGDRLYTDIALGQAGITTILVLSGETRSEDLKMSPFQPDFVMENLLDLYQKISR
jgi:4-nitrophenyl phosphatase